ncbi:MAG: restriction endonuclease subunit S [Candidatus Methanoplasma sp.]|nr:restriction endonuclease subunit S [Candidatus Methanoplasma sp.]
MNTKLLRQRILDLAIRGKLVLQDSNDEPASVLLERIRAEKGETRRDTSKNAIDESNFEQLPKGWARATLSSLATFSGGKTPSGNNPLFWNGDVNWVTSKDMKQKYISTTQKKMTELGAQQMRTFPPNTLLMVVRSGILKHNLPIAILTTESTINQDIKAISLHVNEMSGFVYIFLSAMSDVILKKYHKDGTTVDSIKFENLKSISVPVPPLAEQNRIVGKVESMFELIDEIEQNESDIQSAIVDIRSKILSLAISGKLIPQDPSDEPASALLERMRAEKNALARAGKSKKGNNDSVIFRRDNSHYEKLGGTERLIDGEIPFEIPESWAWARLGSLGQMSRGSGIRRSDIAAHGAPCVRYGEMYTTYGAAIREAASFVDEGLALRSKLAHAGDILFALTGETKEDIGKAAAYMGAEAAAVGGDLAVLSGHGMDPMFLSYAMGSPYAAGRKASLATGDMIVHLSAARLGSVLVPVPPLAEQARIAGRVGEALGALGLAGGEAPLASPPPRRRSTSAPWRSS